jgi:hypothetical protein
LDVYGPSGTALTQRSRWSYYWGVSDIEITESAGFSHMAVACDDSYGYGCWSSGSAGYAGYLSSYQNGGSASGNMAINLPGYDMVDIDVSGTAAGEAVICMVSDTGLSWLLLADVLGTGTFEEITIEDGTADTVDECAVTVTDNGELVLALRYGDEIRIGYLDDY